jgi:3-phosphoshikimate 1-carboxyvinyltransferase
MDIKVFPNTLSGTISVISSKSLSHRYVIAAGLANGVSHIKNIMASDDLDATKSALKGLNTDIENEFIKGGNLKIVTPQIDCKASGSTLRFMIPIAMLLNEIVTFIGIDQLPKRPLDIYEKLFTEKGYHYKRLSKDHLPVEIKGPLKGGTYLVDGNISSQFISGLLFALPMCKEDSIIQINGELESRPYVDLTIDVLRQFDIHIENKASQFHIKGNQSYQPIQASIEGDFSQAAFFMVAGTIGNTITCQGLNPNSLQGDRKIVDLILQMGGKIESDENHYKVYPKKTIAATIDLKHVPDLGPILMVLAALSQGTTRFLNTQRLKFKESDRLNAMMEILIKFGVQTRLINDTLEIDGVSCLRGNQSFDTYKDHRIAMALLIASIKCDAPIIIKDIEVINKSYPNFLEAFSSLGGQYAVIN